MPTSLARPRGRWLVFAGQCAGLLALTLLAYGPIWQNGFVDFDDEPYITTNPGVLRGLSWEGFRWAWMNADGPYAMPVTWLSLQADAHFFSRRGPDGTTILSAAAVHGQNLFWHAAASLLLFGLWHRLTGATGSSFLAAALFAVHPMHVESVAWAIERKDVLSGFFGVLALWAYVRWVDRPSRLRFACLSAAYGTSLLAKPMLITLPFLLLLLDYWPLRRFEVSPLVPTVPSLARLVREKMILFGLALVAAVATLVSRQDHGALTPLSTVSLSARLANAVLGYGWYVWTTFYPTGLGALYPHRGDHWSLALLLAAALGLAGAGAAVGWQARRQPWLLIGGLWFVIGLLPVIGLAQGGGQAWADRFSYWPHVGLFAAVAWTLAGASRRLRLPPVLAGTAAALLLVGLVGSTRAQVRCWRDSITLWEHTLAVTTNNPRAHEHLSLCYRKQGRREEADQQLHAAHRIQCLLAGRPEPLRAVATAPVATPSSLPPH